MIGAGFCRSSHAVLLQLRHADLAQRRHRRRDLDQPACGARASRRRDPDDAGERLAAATHRRLQASVGLGPRLPASLTLDRHKPSRPSLATARRAAGFARRRLRWPATWAPCSLHPRRAVPYIGVSASVSSASITLTSGAQDHAGRDLPVRRSALCPLRSARVPRHDGDQRDRTGLDRAAGPALERGFAGGNRPLVSRNFQSRREPYYARGISLFGDCSASPRLGTLAQQVAC